MVDRFAEELSLERRLAAVLVADVVGFSRHMAENEARTLERVKDLEHNIIQPCVDKYGGRIVKLTGDGHISEFQTASGAISAALDIVETNLQSQQNNLAADRLQIRSGINLGEILITESDIFGNGVNIAARLEALAEPDSVYLSQSVIQALQGQVEQPYEFLGEKQLKNIPEPVPVYRIKGQAPSIEPVHLQPEQDVIDLAVLPFRNISGDAEQEFFCDGVTEDIIIDLSKIASFDVAARSATFGFKNQHSTLSEIGDALKVRYIVDGSIRKAGERIRVTVELTEVKTGKQVWTERYDRDLTDVFAVQDEISQSIVHSLSAVISPLEQSRIRRRSTENPDAYSEYLKGRQNTYQMTKTGLESAHKHFSRAIELDGQYALAYAGLAECDVLMNMYYSSDVELLDRALNAAQQAVLLASHRAEVHAALGFVYTQQRKSEEAVSELKLAIELDPALYEAYYYWAILELWRKKYNAALSLFRSASEIRIGDLQTSMMQLTLLASGDDKEALQQTAKRVREHTTRILALNPDDARAAHVAALAMLHLGDRSRALELLEISAKSESLDSRASYNLACVYSLAGDLDKSLNYFERSLSSGRPKHMISWARNDPELTNVQELPRFKKLLDEWGEKS